MKVMSTVRRAGAILALATMVAAAAYFFLYLYRWQWDRALASGAVFVAAEVGIVAWVLFERMHRAGTGLHVLVLDARRRPVDAIS
jgi:Kef-type K+ transport system membrane component KefB